MIWMGKRWSIREDDREEVVRERLEQYEAQTRPLIEFFRSWRPSVDRSGCQPGNARRWFSGRSRKSWLTRTRHDDRSARDEQAMIVRKTPSELEKMRRSGLLVYEILQALGEMVEEGVSTWNSEVAAVKMMADAGAKPAFKDYFVPAAGERYRFVLCTSVNDEIVHGMPNAEADVEEGRYRFDRYGRAAGRIFRRFGDTVGVGEMSEQAKKLLKVTEESLELAIDKVREGNRLFDICGTVEQHVVENGFSIVREYVGHGIGTQLHEEPQVPELRGSEERESAAARGHGARHRADGECGEAGSEGFEG